MKSSKADGKMLERYGVQILSSGPSGSGLRAAITRGMSAAFHTLKGVSSYLYLPRREAHPSNHARRIGRGGVEDRRSES